MYRQGQPRDNLGGFDHRVDANSRVEDTVANNAESWYSYRYGQCSCRKRRKYPCSLQELPVTSSKTDHSRYYAKQSGLFKPNRETRGMFQSVATSDQFCYGFASGRQARRVIMAVYVDVSRNAPVSNASFGWPARVRQAVPVSINYKENGSIPTTTQPFCLKTLRSII